MLTWRPPPSHSGTPAGGRTIAGHGSCPAFMAEDGGAEDGGAQDSGGRRAPGGQPGRLHQPAAGIKTAADGGAERHQQDPPRRHHHAGEPVVRLVLRHLPRSRRDPGRERPVHGVRARPAHQGLRQALPRSEPGQRRCGAQPVRRNRGHRRRQDGRVRQERRAGVHPRLQHHPASVGVPAQQPAAVWSGLSSQSGWMPLCT